MDDSALGSLYRRYGTLVFGLALRILRSREEAEDLTHDVFLSLCDSTCAAFDPSRGAAGAYLTALTRSRAIDRVRRRCRRARLLCAASSATVEPAPPTPFDLALLRRSAERLRARMSALPERQRVVLELAYEQGMTQREIAADLATPVGTVKSLTRRALDALGRALGE